MTLLGQSLGSLVLGWEAFSLLVPDIFVDTMGYAFTLGLSKVLFPSMPTGAYVHYPTISTDMLDSLDPKKAAGSQGVNAGKGVGLKGFLKKYYWKAFAAIYSSMGASVDVVMTNSSWTQAHIKSLWGPRRQRRQQKHPIAVVYPPCAVESIEKAVEVSESSEQKRGKYIVYIAQFRPEKNHQMIVQAFAQFVKSGSAAAEGATLVLLGSVRDDNDSRRVYELRLLVNELHIKDCVIFQLDAPWSEVLEWLRKASVGVNGMWNEHFGIGVVEYLAAGLIPVVHNSGGPKLDIVTDVDNKPTGISESLLVIYVNRVLIRNFFRLPCQHRIRIRGWLREGPFITRPPGCSTEGSGRCSEILRGGVRAQVAGGDAEASCYEEDMNVTDTDVLVYSLQLTYRNTENTARYGTIPSGLAWRTTGKGVWFAITLSSFVISTCITMTRKNG